MNWEEIDLFSGCLTWLDLDRATQEKVPLCERHGGEKMRKGANSFLKMGGIDFLVVILQIFCSFVVT